MCMCMCMYMYMYVHMYIYICPVLWGLQEEQWNNRTTQKTYKIYNYFTPIFIRSPDPFFKVFPIFPIIRLKGKYEQCRVRAKQ